MKINKLLLNLGIISSFFIFSSMPHAKEKNIMKDNCLSIQSEEVFWSTHIDKKNEFPLSLYIPVSMQKEVKMFDSKIKEVGCLSNSMLFIHLNIDNGVRKLYYYTWDNNVKVYHINLSDKSNSITPVLDTVIIKKDMKIFDDIITLLKNTNPFINIENKFLLDGSQVYLIIKKNQKIVRFASYSQKFNNNMDIFDFAKYIKFTSQNK